MNSPRKRTCGFSRPSTDVDRSQIPIWLERVGLLRVREGLAREFSRGMRQRLAIARAFLHNPAVLVLDEPFTSLDDRAIALLQSLLRQALERGASVIMSTHQLREALETRHRRSTSERRKSRPLRPARAADARRPHLALRAIRRRMKFVWAIARKDLRSELRSKEATNAAISFALVILLILNIAFEPTGDEKSTMAGGLLWIVFAFSATLILNRTFARELQNDALEALIAAPVPGWAPLPRQSRSQASS